MRGKPVYICGSYIESLRALYQRSEDDEIAMDYHFGLHVVTGEYGDSLTIAPVFGQRIEARVPRYAVWMLEEKTTCPTES